MNKTISRRKLLKGTLAFGGFILANNALAACGDSATNTSASPTTAASSAATPTSPPASSVAATTAVAGATTADSIALTPAEIDKIKAMKLRIGFNTNNRTDDFSNTLIKGGQDTAQKYGIDLIVGSADFDENKQLSDINSLIQQKVDAIFMVAVNGDSISSAILKANQANIPVIVIGGPPSRGNVISVMNSTSYQGCYDAAKVLCQKLGGKGKVVAITIPLPLETIKDRDRGTVDGIRDGGCTLIGSPQPVQKQEEAVTVVQNLIQANPDLAGVMAEWSLAVNGALAAIQQSGKNIFLAGYDAEAAGYKAFAQKEPHLLALAGQQAFLQGKVGLDALCKVKLGQTVASKIEVPTLLVTPDNYQTMWGKQYPGLPTPF